MLKDRAPVVRATALQALAVLHKDDASRLLRKHLRDSEPRIAVTAAVLLADSDTDAEVCAGEDTLTTLVEDVSPSVRREVPTVLAHVKNARCRALLVPLIHDVEARWLASPSAVPTCSRQRTSCWCPP
jgi:HEAT repeat protein